MSLLTDDQPPVPVLVLDDGGDDVEGASPRHVADLSPGVGGGRVVVGLGSLAAAVTATKHVDPSLHLKNIENIIKNNARMSYSFVRLVLMFLHREYLDF